MNGQFIFHGPSTGRTPRRGVRSKRVVPRVATRNGATRAGLKGKTAHSPFRVAKRGTSQVSGPDTLWRVRWTRLLGFSLLMFHLLQSIPDVEQFR